MGTDNGYHDGFSKEEFEDEDGIALKLGSNHITICVLRKAHTVEALDRSGKCRGQT